MCCVNSAPVHPSIAQVVASVTHTTPGLCLAQLLSSLVWSAREEGRGREGRTPDSGGESLAAFLPAVPVHVTLGQGAHE